MEQLIEFFTNHYFLSGAALIFLILIIISFIQSATNGSLSLNSIATSQMINKESAQLVDLRSIADFNKGHIQGSINIPFTKLKDSTKDLEKYKQNPMIMVCATGFQAGAAATLLRSKGFEQVHKLKGGIQTWSADNLPLAKG